VVDGRPEHETEKDYTVHKIGIYGQLCLGVLYEVQQSASALL